MTRAALTLSVLFLFGHAFRAEARVFLTVDQALDLAFPGCSVERQTVFLTGSQKARVESLAGSKLRSKIAYPYRSRECERAAGGVAYFDTHRVRTKEETLMIVLAPDGSLRRLEVVTFREPEEYLPRESWYRQFLGRLLDNDLRLRRGIDAVTGATLTARSTTDAVRRAMAIEQILNLEPKGGEP